MNLSEAEAEIKYLRTANRELLKALEAIMNAHRHAAGEQISLDNYLGDNALAAIDTATTPRTK
ncbi:MAG: hypothetical protein V3T62_03310 [Alphaproteobacteria bacterium]